MPIVDEPTSVHVVPLGDRYAVKVVPLRTSFTQYGATGPETLVLVLLPPVLDRRMKLTPLEGVTNTPACFAFAASESRNITPALARPFVLVIPSTRAMIVPSPVSWR